MQANPRPTWRTRAVPVVGAVATALVLAMCTVGTSGPLTTVIPSLIGGTAVAVVLWAVRRWRADRADYERRLTEWAAAEAVLAERLRIARDLHDLVSHGLGLITVRAAATRHLPASSEVRDALDDIEETSRHATGELRRMLTVLRDPSEAGPRTPLEDLHALPEIVRAAEAAGLRPRLAADPLGVVTQGVQVAVCKTVREALSNAARHAGPTSVDVRLCRDGPFVVVSVADDGPAAGGWHAVPGAGHGLSGLRERIDSLGGTLTAGPSGDGFRLTARIPDTPPTGSRAFTPDAHGAGVRAAEVGAAVRTGAASLASDVSGPGAGSGASDVSRPGVSSGASGACGPGAGPGAGASAGSGASGSGGRGSESTGGRA
ncbi:sensor histidine kinase [Actinoplanes sp. NPDC023714]|uniref:sensor histidine kinase n=1 Tax=Actinoplanes sp. NPDC023714 TaxID=3154322 RepID=UPI0033C5C440